MNDLAPLTRTALVPTCADCGAPRFSRKPKKSPYCFRCNGRHVGKSPQRRANASAAMKAHLADPHVRANHIRRAAEGLRRRLATDPEFAEQRRERGRIVGLSKLGVTPAGSPSRIAAGKTSSATKLAWCPPEYRDEYKRLIKRQNMKAAEARPIIEDMIAVDARRYAATGILPQSTRTGGAAA